MNMSYCAFENTSADLDQCVDKLNELIDDGCETLTDFSEALNEYEFRGLKRLMSAARELLDIAEHTDL